MAPCRSSPTPPKSYVVPPQPPLKGPLPLETLEDPLEHKERPPLEDLPLDLLLCCPLRTLPSLATLVRNADPPRSDRNRMI